jgi:hypothetical protein
MSPDGGLLVISAVVDAAGVGAPDATAGGAPEEAGDALAAALEAAGDALLAGAPEAAAEALAAPVDFCFG